MRWLSPAEILAIAARTVEARDFVTVTVKDRLTGNPVRKGFWSDAGAFTADIVDARTSLTEAWPCIGGALVSVGDVPLISDITVRTVDVVFSAIDGDVSELVRAYDARNAPIQISRGYFNPVTHELVAPAKSRFLGFVDTAPIETAAEGGASTVTFTCASHTRELKRKNTDVRSHESQILRKAGDDFYRDTGVVGEWEISWGKKKGKAG